MLENTFSNLFLALCTLTTHSISMVKLVVLKVSVYLLYQGMNARDRNAPLNLLVEDFDLFVEYIELQRR